MKQSYLCIKELKIKNLLHFEEGKYYKGKKIKNEMGNGLKYVEIRSGFGMKMDFHSKSEYFRIS
jgi:hypothetical protein